MDIQNHCMSIKLAKLIVNAQKHNLLNSFCNNGYVYVKLGYGLLLLKNKSKTETESNSGGCRRGPVWC